MVCPSCGHKNSPIPENKRCIACGAVMEQLKSASTTTRRSQQEGFSPKWFGIALGVQAVLTLVVLVGVDAAVDALDFEGYNGMALSVPAWFLGGMLVGMISPGKTFVEPVLASFLVALPTVVLLEANQTVRTMPFFMYVILALIGVLFSLVGSYMGERIQLGPPPKTVD